MDCQKLGVPKTLPKTSYMFLSIRFYFYTSVDVVSRTYCDSSSNVLHPYSTRHDLKDFNSSKTYRLVFILTLRTFFTKFPIVLKIPGRPKYRNCNQSFLCVFVFN